MKAEERAKSALAEYRVYASKVNSEAFEDVVSLSIQEAVEAEREAVADELKRKYSALMVGAHGKLSKDLQAFMQRMDVELRARGEGEG